MKKYVIIIIIMGIILGFLTGLYLYKINQIEKSNAIITENVELNKLDDEESLNLLKTSNQQEKTSPNCVIVLKVYHTACEHLIETRKNIEEAEVNMTEAELKNEFQDWEIQKFTPTEIVLYKEVPEFCDEHYLLRDEDGYITIYKLNEKGETEFFNKTEIATKYLAQEDLDRMKTGLKVYTDKELNKTLEDFE